MGTNFKGNIATVAMVATLMAAPAALMAGSYGSTAVKDDNVGRYASTGNQVWCARLDRNIPADLAAQMECGGSARPAVADNRITRLPSSSRDEDKDDRRTVTRRKPEPETPTTGGKPGKWDRLGQLNVTPQNFDQQSPSFRDQVRSYYDTAGGPNGDWSGFNPNP